MEIPTIEDIKRQTIARYHDRITAGLARTDLADFSNVVESYRREHDAPIERIAAVLAALAQGDSPLLLSETRPEPGFDDHCDFDPRRSNSHPGISGERRRGGKDGTGTRRANDSRGSEPMEKYRIEVGHSHDVKPTNIVGAIANETGLHSRFIGRIEIFDEYSTVDLLTGMPPAMFQTLKNVKISGRRLDISRVDQPSSSEERPEPIVSDVAAAVEQPVQKTIDARPADERRFQKSHRMRAASEIGTASRNFRRKPKSGAVHSFGKLSTKRRKAKLGQRSSR
jgi:ATP-dependent RNA helicase DeaD